MKFSPGYWTHDKFMDVAIKVVKVRYCNEKYSRLQIQWVNLGWTGKPWAIYPDTETLTVLEKNYSEWKPLDNIERFAI